MTINAVSNGTRNFVLPPQPIQRAPETKIQAGWPARLFYNAINTREYDRAYSTVNPGHS